MLNNVWFCVGAAGIGFAIMMLAVAISQLHDDLKKILQRWAALDNLKIFNPDDDDMEDPNV